MRTVFTFFLLFVTLFCFAQIERGTLLLKGDIGITKDVNPGEDNIGVYFQPQVGYFLGKNWLVGTYLQYYYSTFNSDSDISSFYIAPFVRYYFPFAASKWNWFLQALGGYQRTVFDDPVFASVYNVWQASAGGGFDYFLNSNIAIESILQYEGFFRENQTTHNINLNAGLQFFLPVAADSTSEGTAIHKSARLINLSASARWSNFSSFENDYAFLSLQPTLGFFVTDRLLAGSGLFLGFSDQNTIVEPQPFVRYYFESKGSLLQPFVNLGLRARFQFADKSSEASFFNLDATGGVGIDFFLTRNVALEGILQLDGSQIEDQQLNRNLLNFNIGLQFFLDE